MKKRFFKLIFLNLLLILFISGCAAKDSSVSATAENDSNQKQHVEQVGQVPDEFRRIIDENAFKDITVSSGKLLKAETLSDNTVQVKMMDLYGNELVSYQFSADAGYFVNSLTATSDGGFLFVLDFQDYTIGDNTWASDDGYLTRVIKCDKDGKLQFDTEIDCTGTEYCFEKNEQFYVFGDCETPETKIRGVGSPTDVSMIVINKNGERINKKSIEGSDYDCLKSAEPSGECFVLSISSQSDDKDFTGSDSDGHPVDWIASVNDNLEITDMKKGSGRDYSEKILGEIDGAPIYESSDIFDSFNTFVTGMPTAVIDYGNFILIVSENITGAYEKTPSAISSAWYYTETVYSAYNKNDELIFRASTDSSPDYDSMLLALENE